MALSADIRREARQRAVAGAAINPPFNEARPIMTCVLLSFTCVQEKSANILAHEAAVAQRRSSSSQGVELLLTNVKEVGVGVGVGAALEHHFTSRDF